MNKTRSYIRIPTSHNYIINMASISKIPYDDLKMKNEELALL